MRRRDGEFISEGRHNSELVVCKSILPHEGEEEVKDSSEVCRDVKFNIVACCEAIFSNAF